MMNIFRRDGGRQVDTGTYDADELGDLATIVRSVYAQLSNATLDADAHARVSAYSDVHQAGNLYTQSGTHVSRHATSTAMMNEGAAGGLARSHNDD